jgi:hypothetical protein
MVVLDMELSGEGADPETSVQNDNCRQIGGSCVKKTKRARTAGAGRTTSGEHLQWRLDVSCRKGISRPPTCQSDPGPARSDRGR